MALSEISSSIVELWWSWMWPMFWQVGLLVMLVAVLDKFVRRGHHPHIRLTLWSLVLLKLVIPPAWALETSLTSILFGAEAVPVLVHDAADLIHSASDDPQRSFGAAAAQVLSLRNPGAGSSLANLLTWTLMGVWLCGAVFFGTLLVRRIRSFSASLRATGKAAPVHLQDLAEEASKRIGLKSTPEVVIGDALHSAAVMGLRRPFIYVPSQMVTELGRKDLYHVLLHEMAHIKRGDLWVQAIGMALQVIYWFNPLVWFVRKRLHELRELCCDATVARRLGSAQHYRSSLLQAAKRLLPAGVPRTPMVGQLALFEDCAGIVTRIRALESRGWQYSSVRKFWNVMAAGAFVLLCLPMGAQSAQGECADILKWAEARLEYLQQQKDTKADGAAEVFNEQSS